MSKSSTKSVPSANAKIGRLQRELAVSKSLADNSPINILLADTNLTITYANAASIRTLESIEHLLPFRATELIGASIDLFYKDARQQRRILLNDKNLPHREVIVLEGEKLDLLVSPTYDASGKYIGPMGTTACLSIWNTPAAATTRSSGRS